MHANVTYVSIPFISSTLSLTHMAHSMQIPSTGKGSPLQTFLEGVAEAVDVPAFVAQAGFGLPPLDVCCLSELRQSLIAEERNDGETHGNRKRRKIY
jgi:hypothetical protein